MTGNPYVDEVEASNPYLDLEEQPVEQEFSTKLNPLEQAKWDALARGPLQPMGTFGPIQPPEEALMGPNIFTGLFAGAKAAKAVAEPVFQAAEDIGSEALRSFGVPAYPGKPLIETGPYPITAGGPLGQILRAVSPQTAAAIDQTTGELISGFSTPGNIVLAGAPIAKPLMAKPIQGLFTAGVAGSIPESLQSVAEAQSGPERTGALTKLGSEIGMAYFLGRHMGQGRTIRERIRDASSQPEAAKVYGDVRPLAGEGQREMPANESGAGVQPQAQAVAEATRVPLISEEGQVLLDEGMLNNRDLGLGSEIRVVERFGGDREGLAVFDSSPAIVDSSGEFVRPGTITVNAQGLSNWMNDMKGKSPEQVKSAFLSLFAEEGIHSITTPAEAKAYLESLTPLERKIGSRQYLGDIDPTQIDFNDTKLGYELVRQRMQRILNMEPTEIAELSRMEGWGTKGMEIISRIIRRLRELIGTRASKSGLRITSEMLDRAESNIAKAEKLTPEELATVEQPFGIRRRPAQEAEDAIDRLRNADMKAFHDEVTSNERGLTGEAWDLGYSVTSPAQLDDLMQGYQDAGLNFREAMKAKDLKRAGFEAMRGQFFREAYEAATGTGSAGRSLSQELGAEYQPPFPNIGVQGIRRGPREGKEALAERLVYMGKANTMSEAVRMLDNDRDIKQLAETMVYKGEARTVTDAVTDIEQGNAPHYVYQAIYDWSKPGAQGIRRKPGKGEMELPLFVPPKGVEKETFEKGVRIEAKDHPEIAANHPELLPQLVRDELKLDSKAYQQDADPGIQGLRRRKPSAGEQEFAFGDLFSKKPETQLPEGATPAPEKLKLPLGGTPELPLPESKPAVTGPVMSRKTMEHLGQESLPTWKPAPGKALPEGTGYDFEARHRTLAETEKVAASTVEQQLDQYLTTAKKPRFTDAVRSIEGAQAGHMREAWRDSVWRVLENMPGEQVMKLRDQLGLGRQVGTGRIADPLPAKLERGKTRMTPEQQYRLKTLAEIGTTLIEQADKNAAKGWHRKTVTPEEVGFWREKNSKESAVRKITQADRNNPEVLGDILTSDAAVERSTVRKKVRNGQLVEVQQKAPPESITKRLTALVDKNTGEVHLVSTYRKSRGGPYAVDPTLTRLQRPNVPLERLLKRYDPIFSVLMDEPVQNFHQKFKSVREFNDQFLKPAADRARKIASSEEVLATSAEAEGKHGELAPSSKTTGRVAKAGIAMAEPGSLDRGGIITPAESEALLYNIDYYLPEGLTEVEGIDVVLGSLLKRSEMKWLEPRDRQAISALQKAYDAIKAKWDVLTDEQALAQLKDEIFYEAQKTDSAADFHQRLAERYGEEGAQDVRPESTGKTASAETGAREIEIKPTREKLRPWEPSTVKGPGPEPKLPVPKDPEMLSPDELAYVKELGLQMYPDRKLTPEAQGVLGIRRLAKGAASSMLDIADKTGGEFMRWYSEWMVEKLERVGGPYSKVLAKTINWIISREREIYGGITPMLDQARKLAGRLGPATTYLKGLYEVTPRAAISKLVGAVEGTATVPRYAQPLVDALQQANLEIGRLLLGIHASGKFQRNLTGEGVDIIRQGSGPAWEAMVEGNAVANGIPHGDAVAFFKEMKAKLDRPDITQAEIEKVNQDFERVMPKAVTHVKVNRPFPRWIPILHADAFNYLENAARRSSHVKAFRERFPNTPQGIKDFNTLMADVRSEMPGDYYIDNLTALMRAIQGHPTDTYKANPLTGVGTYGREAMQFVNQTIGGLFAKLALSAQMSTQLPETFIGATPMFLGSRNYLRAMARLRQLYPELEQNGAVNRVILDYTFDPHSSIRSSFRIAGNVISKVFAEHLLNELQEGLAAATAKIVSERIQNTIHFQRAGRTGGMRGSVSMLTPWEQAMLPETFKAMGFSPAEARSMMLGNADLLSQFERKAASFLTSGNKAIAEGSKLGANRFVNTIFRFQSYPMMKMNQLRKTWSNTVDAWQSGTPMEKAASTYLLGRYLFGATAQGALTVGISALALEGLGGARIRWNEAKDEPIQFMTESMLSSMSGPIYMLWRGAKDKGLAGVADRIVKSIFPLSVMNEMYNYAFGIGPQYKDKSLWDRTAAFIKNKTPGTKIIGSGLAAAGLSSENKELDSAITAFYRYSRENWGSSGQGPLMKNDERKEFRTALRKAIEAMKRGNAKAFDEAMDKVAFYAPNAKSMDQSIRAKAMFKKPDGKEITPEEEQALRKHIGNRAVDMLQDWDSMVEALAPKKQR